MPLYRARWSDIFSIIGPFRKLRTPDRSLIYPAWFGIVVAYLPGEHVNSLAKACCAVIQLVTVL